MERRSYISRQVPPLGAGTSPSSLFPLLLLVVLLVWWVKHRGGRRQLPCPPPSLPEWVPLLGGHSLQVGKNGMGQWMDNWIKKLG
ncbi:unnamed protein product, partial [Chrysoparadoxa australica]